ncbi:8844c884-3799-47c5-9b7d-28d65aa0db70-CDS [Sclerotinia trifoliorum]|uniref:8844c884-3799-47c5-9b7d-28d65aa0db70-CDS n=1 Tax=Sclerotinia trifoliorum TaxID=28548 RepID=A0A8H2ZV24_9HELO|nr:8844c884-3799-47c5-9b7d-28d65aa0db70-CDS [Sclerotinia trifoliorum]
MGTFDTSSSFQYPSANNSTWPPTEGAASSILEATISGMNSMSLTASRAALPNHFNSQVSQRLSSAGIRYISRGPNTDDTGTLDPRYQVHAGLREDDFWIQLESSICCPIHTYSNQATLKPNLPLPERHTIIHTTLLTVDLILDPVRAMSESSDHEGKLHELSRLNYIKVYNVEHYVRVSNIRKVASESRDSLSKGYNSIKISYWIL